MPRDLELKEINGNVEHVTRGTNNVFKGHVVKDLDSGDIYEDQDENGFVRKMKIKSKEVTPRGYTIIVSEEVFV
jgi:hypothetical protein